MTETAGISPPHLITASFLPADEREELLRWAIANEHLFKPALTDHGLQQVARHALCLRDLGPWAERLQARALGELPHWINQLRVTPFVPSVVELELVAHNHGAHFTIHSDTYSSSQPARGDRMLSAIYYFHDPSPQFSGGDLRLHRVGAATVANALDINPCSDRLVVFPSWWPHEVMRVSCASGAFEHSRFSLNCWVHRARPDGPEALP